MNPMTSTPPVPPRGWAAEPSLDAPVERTLRDLPGPRRLPVLGNPAQLRVSRIHMSLEAWTQRYGNTYRLYMGRRPTMVTSDPAVIRDALRRRPGDFRRITAVAAALDEIMGGTGVFHAEGETWGQHRALANRALDVRHVRAFLPRMASIAERLRRRWIGAATHGTVIDLQEDLMRFTVDVTASLVLGHDPDTLSHSGDAIQRHLAHVFPRLARRLMAPVPYWRTVRLPADRRLDRAMAEVRAYCLERITDAECSLARDPERAARPENLLEAMLAGEDRPRLAPEDVVANMLTMLLAGEDTTANTITWAVHEVLQEPAALERLQAEVDGSGSVDPDAFLEPQRFPWTDAVVAETMRLRPVAPLHLLVANHDVTLGGIALPAGTAAALLTRPAGMDPGRVADPRAFQPQRWTAPRSAPADWRADQMPFGGGPRLCPGRGLALVEARLVLAMLFRSFRVEAVGDPARVRERYAFTMEPTRIAVRLRLRSAPSTYLCSMHGLP